jgi:transposase
MAAQKPIEVVMEACYSSHHWGRGFAAMGHRDRLLSVQPGATLLRSEKSDHNDAVAISEAVHRPINLGIVTETGTVSAKRLISDGCNVLSC